MNQINLPPRGAFWRVAKLTGLLLLPLAAMNAAAVNFPVGTHLIKGTLKDWQNKVLTSSAAVTVQAVSTNGSVIASTKVADPTADGCNFLLQIPLSSKATESTAAVGDKLNCVLVQESGLSLAVEQLDVGDANTVSNVCLAFVNMKDYTKDGTTVKVAQEYVDTIAVWMEVLGYESLRRVGQTRNHRLRRASKRPPCHQLRICWRPRLWRRHDALAHESQMGGPARQEIRDGRRAGAGNAVRRRGGCGHDDHLRGACRGRDQPVLQA